MKSTKGSPVLYQPDPPPADLPDSARRYLDNELHKIAGLLRALATGVHLDPLAASPAKPRPGDLVFADGTHWNPGSGEGPYTYMSNGTWKPL